jgi:hypothetical protein
MSVCSILDRIESPRQDFDSCQLPKHKALPQTEKFARWRSDDVCHHPSGICSQVGSGAPIVGVFGERSDQRAYKAQKGEDIARRVEPVPAPP